MEPFARAAHRFIYETAMLRAHTPPRTKDSSRQSNNLILFIIMLSITLSHYKNDIEKQNHCRLPGTLQWGDTLISQIRHDQKIIFKHIT